jgi:hypothetical protein
MAEREQDLIDRLSRDAQPVRPLPPPLFRATLLLAALVAVMALTVAVAGKGAALSLSDDPVFLVSAASVFLTGVASVIAAITLSVPGRSDRWAWLPLPPALVWLIASAVECYQHIRLEGITDFSPFASRDCFLFITLAGAPIAVAIYLVLRRAIATSLLPVTALSGLAAATLANALLTFFHPHGTTPIDTLTHITAISLVMVVMMTAGRRALERA